jgi:hypothetical protein
MYLIQIDILNSGNALKETIVFDSRIDSSYNIMISLITLRKGI